MYSKDRIGTITLKTNITYHIGIIILNLNFRILDLKKKEFMN